MFLHCLISELFIATGKIYTHAVRGMGMPTRSTMFNLRAMETPTHGNNQLKHQSAGIIKSNPISAYDH